MRKEFERVSPEEVGVHSEAVLNLIEKLEDTGAQLHGIMILRHGKVLAEGWWSPYAPGIRHGCQSLTKTYTATAIGLLYDEGMINLDEKIVDMNPVRKEMVLSNGMTRPWYEYISPLRKTQKVPLVFCLHGGAGDGYHAFECGNLKRVADQYPMIIISPLIEDVPRSFELRPESECVTIAKEFYDKICMKYEGMYNRIFVMGYSIGEFLAFQLCRKYNGLVDAFAGAVAPAPAETYCDERGRPVFYPGQKPIPAFLWRGINDFLYTMLTTGHEDVQLQEKVVSEYRGYWEVWNQTKERQKEETENYIVETYKQYGQRLIHVLAKGMGHSDEKDVFAVAWEMLFSKYTKE